MIQAIEHLTLASCVPTKSRVLVFFTHDFPYRNGEEFIENEYPFLVKSFNRIYIINTASYPPITRRIEPSTVVIRFSYHCNIFEKCIAIMQALFRKEYIHEIRQLNKSIKQKKTLKTHLSIAYSIYKARSVKNYIIRNIIKGNVRDHKVYLYSYWMDTMAIAIGLIKNDVPEITGICRAHRWDLYLENNDYLPLRNYILKNLDAVFCISNHGASYLTNWFPNLKEKIHVKRLGTFPVEKKNNPKCHDRIRITSISSFSHAKRISMLIEALSLINDVTIDWTHIGHHTTKQYEYLLAHDLLIHKPNISFRFLGTLQNRDVITYLQNGNSDLLVNVSSSEGIPVTFMESMSCGIPVLAFDVGGVSEIVSQENGFLLPQTAGASEIASKIIEFAIMSSEQKNKKSEAAFRTWEELFNAERNYIDFLNTVFNL